MLFNVLYYSIFHEFCKLLLVKFTNAYRKCKLIISCIAIGCVVVFGGNFVLLHRIVGQAYIYILNLDGN